MDGYLVATVAVLAVIAGVRLMRQLLRVFIEPPSWGHE